MSSKSKSIEKEYEEFQVWNILNIRNINQSMRKPLLGTNFNQNQKIIGGPKIIIDDYKLLSAKKQILSKKTKLINFFHKIFFVLFMQCLANLKRKKLLTSQQKCKINHTILKFKHPDAKSLNLPSKITDYDGQGTTSLLTNFMYKSSARIQNSIHNFHSRQGKKFIKSFKTRTLGK